MRRLLALYLVFLFLAPASWAQEDCPPHPVRVEGGSLSPLVSPGESVMMRPASCAGDIRHGDLAIFKTGAEERPVIKIVYGLPGDMFGIEDGFIGVNGIRLRTSDGSLFRLSAARAQMLALYEMRFGGVIPAHTYLMLGERAAGALDSTRIGLVHRNDILMVGPSVLTEGSIP